jgi:acetoin utilization deacetylase AcuC-like enzyme/GNAT superfamily N-acetyltransferase
LGVFRIRRIHDDVLPVNAAAIAQVQALLRTQFPGLRDEMIDALPTQLRDPLAHRLRTVVFVAERGGDVRGFAVLMHAPDLSFAYLDFISSTPDENGRGVGGALYDRVRDECRQNDVVGLFFECLPDEPAEVSDPAVVADNRARLRFYERYGARPLAGIAYNAPLMPGSLDQPYLVFDDLGSGRPLRRAEAHAIIRAILERKYAWLCPPEYINMVVDSIRDDPVRLRPPRYTKPSAAPRARPAAPPPDLRIPLIVNDRHDIHHIRERGYVQAPVRIPAILKELERQPLFAPAEPKTFPKGHILEVHDAGFVEYLRKVCAALPEGRSVYPYVFPIRNQARMPDDLPVRAGYYCIDTFTPLNRNAWLAARRAVDCALTGAMHVLSGSRLAYALVRPPGHHAERRVFGGFCYLNSAAIAAHLLSKTGTVAILDVDYHHGNGQQDIFYERSDVLTVSLHGHPKFAYPYFSGFEDERGEGHGVGFNHNFPLPEKLDGMRYAVHLEQALAQIRAFRPRFLVVCLGLDTGKGDPTGSWSLVGDDFERNGRLIGQLRLPTLVVQEGGYLTRSIGSYARRFFRGLWEANHVRQLPAIE